MALLQHSPPTLFHLHSLKPKLNHPHTLLCHSTSPYLPMPKMLWFRQKTNYNRPIHHRHSSIKSAIQEDGCVGRMLADDHPTLWEDKFTESSTPSNKQYEAVNIQQRIEYLKGKVKKLLMETDEPLQKLILVDTIGNLGLGYHFEKEIHVALQEVYDDDNCIDDNNLYAVALWFKLLRQQGYHVPCSVFEKFKDKDGQFKECITKDARGLLSFFEASHLSTHGEDILDEALTFTGNILWSMRSQLDPSLSRYIEQCSLVSPRGMVRLLARHFISFYEEDETRNPILLELAKLDFNHVQSIHRYEIEELSRWWKDLDLVTRLPFTQDRLVECCMLGMQANYLPQYSLGRIALAKQITLSPPADDIYDFYGKLDELELFTNGVDRWDLALGDLLPDYMKPFFRAIYDLVNDTEFMIPKNREKGIGYIKKMWGHFCQVMLEETKWVHAGYVPSMEELLTLKHATTFGSQIMLIAALGMGDMVSDEEFEYVMRGPKITKLSNYIARLTNEIATYKVDYERGTPSVVKIYMIEHGVSLEEAVIGVRNLIDGYWKDINHELLQPNPLPRHRVQGIVNFARVCETFYIDDRHGLTDSEPWMKDCADLLFLNPIPM